MALITRRENKNEATIQTTNKNSTSYLCKGYLFSLVYRCMFTRKHSTADLVVIIIVAKIRNEPYYLTPIITLIP